MQSFHFLEIISYATMNLLVQIFVGMCVFSILWYIPKSGMAGSRDNAAIHLCDPRSFHAKWKPPFLAFYLRCSSFLPPGSLLLTLPALGDLSQRIMITSPPALH